MSTTITTSSSSTSTDTNESGIKMCKIFHKFNIFCFCSWTHLKLVYIFLLSFSLPLAWKKKLGSFPLKFISFLNLILFLFQYYFDLLYFAFIFTFISWSTSRRVKKKKKKMYKIDFNSYMHACSRSIIIQNWLWKQIINFCKEKENPSARWERLKQRVKLLKLPFDVS